MYGQRPVEALFHSDCGGYTAAAETTWGAPVPYLIPARDDAAHPTRAWTLTVPADDLRAALNADTRSRIGRSVKSLTVTICIFAFLFSIIPVVPAAIAQSQSSDKPLPVFDINKTDYNLRYFQLLT